MSSRLSGAFRGLVRDLRVESDPSTPRDPILAVLLSFLVTGWGQVYAGRKSRGALMFVLNAVLMLNHFAVILRPEVVLNRYILFALPFVFLFGVYFIIDAYACARRYNIKRGLKLRRTPLDFYALLVCASGIFFLSNTYILVIKTYVLQTSRIFSSSMRPALQEGDLILINKAVYRWREPRRGEVILFARHHDPDDALIKRVVAFGGETVEIREGAVWVNGRAVGPRRYLNRGEYGRAGHPVTVPPGSYFVLGDNTQTSIDSRYWGFVSRARLLGQVYKIFWPFQRSGPVPQY